MYLVLLKPVHICVLTIQLLLITRLHLDMRMKLRSRKTEALSVQRSVTILTAHIRILIDVACPTHLRVRARSTLALP
jgi:hypothetical protein